ncbi:hypothetical protein BJX62DRAFT_199389 [Aspergillus germanicus]
MLLAHGDFSTYSRITPLLYLYAHLSLSLSKTREYIILDLCCGQRDSRIELLVGRSGPNSLSYHAAFLCCLAFQARPHFYTCHAARNQLSHIMQDLCITFREPVG